MSKPLEAEEWADLYVHRPVASLLIPMLIRSPLSANQVTVLSGLVGVAAGLTLAWGADHPQARLWSSLLLFASVVLDCCDGQLARARGTSSTLGGLLDGLADYAVGVAMGGSMAYVLACHSGSRSSWLLGVAGMVSMGVQAALFDRAKARYLTQLDCGYQEREGDPEQIARQREAARAHGRRGEALLLFFYERYLRSLRELLRVPPASDPVAYRATQRGHMRAWTFLGTGTRFALAYLLMALSYWWTPALALFFLLNITAGNLFLVHLLRRERPEWHRA